MNIFLEIIRIWYNNVWKIKQFRKININQVGDSSDDFFPVARGVSSNRDTTYFSFQCSEKGSRKYDNNIDYIKRDIGWFSKTTDELNSIFGEVLSNKSFCFLSSLIKNGAEDIDIYS